MRILSFRSRISIYFSAPHTDSLTQYTDQRVASAARVDSPSCWPALRWQLGLDHVRLLNVRRPCEQVVRLGHQRLGHTSRQVCLAARVVWEDVEDCELRVAEPDREPRGRVWLVLDERASALEEPCQ